MTQNNATKGINFEVFNNFTGKFETLDRGAAFQALGKTVHEARTWREVMEQTGLNWEVEKRQLACPVTGEGLQGTYGMFRTDVDGNAGFLGAVGEKFHTVQNERAFRFVDRLIASNPDARYEAAGYTGKGERIFALVNIGSFETVKGDVHNQYFLFTNAHNTDASPKAQLLTLRFACSNQVVSSMRKLARGAGGGAVKLGKKILTFRHTASLLSRMRDAENLMQTARMNTLDLQEKLMELANRQVREAHLQEILEALYPKPKPNADGEISQATQTRRDNKVAAFRELFEYNDGDAFPRLRGTAYNAYQAFTEYTDFAKPVAKTAVKADWSETEIRAARSTFEDGVKEKTQALELVLEKTANCPRVDASPAVRVVSAGGGANNAQLLDSILNQ